MKRKDPPIVSIDNPERIDVALRVLDSHGIADLFVSWRRPSDGPLLNMVLMRLQLDGYPLALIYPAGAFQRLRVVTARKKGALDRSVEN